MLWPMFSSTRCGTWRERREILIIGFVAGIDANSQIMGLLGRVHETLGFSHSITFAIEMFRKSAGMQLDELAAHLRCRLDLLGIRLNEEADLDASLIEFLTRIGQGRPLLGHIQTALGRDLLPAFWNQADNVGLEPQSDGQDFR